MADLIRFERVQSLPAIVTIDTVYYVQSEAGGQVRQYIVGDDGVAVQVTDGVIAQYLFENGVIPAPTVQALEQYLEDMARAQATQVVTQIASTVGADAGRLAGMTVAEEIAEAARVANVGYFDALVQAQLDLLEGRRVPTFQTQIYGIEVTDVPTLVLAQDEYRTGGLIGSSVGDLVLGLNNSQPEFDSFFHPVFAGPSVGTDLISKDALYVRARWPLGSENEANGVPVRVPIALTIQRLIEGTAPTVTLGDRVVGQFPDALPGRYRAAVRDFVNALDGAGLYGTKLRFVRLPNATLANEAINIINPGGTQTVKRGIGTLTHTPLLGVKGDGAAWLDTQLTPSGLGQTFDNNMIYFWPFGTEAHDDQISIGYSSQLALQPNINATQAAFRSGSSRDVAAVVLGSAIALSRTLATEYHRYSGATELPLATRTVTTINDRSTLLLAANSGNGATAVSTLGMRAAAAGSYLTAAEMAFFHGEVAKVLAVADQLRGA